MQSQAWLARALHAQACAHQRIDIIFTIVQTEFYNSCAAHRLKSHEAPWFSAAVQSLHACKMESNMLILFVVTPNSGQQH
jgi:hypothetical protein